MGSKRAMLRNGLGHVLESESASSERVVDLFCGSASVSWFAAQKLQKPVLAVDLQEYAVALARAVICRDAAMDASEIESKWLEDVRSARTKSSVWLEALELDESGINTATWGKWSRDLCAERSDEGGPIWSSYGGHYFSPTQAITLDSMLDCLPTDAAERSVCLATVIVAASRCAASPGHTAQPFKSTGRAGPFLREAWLRDPLQYAKKFLESTCPMHATTQGEAIKGDANDIVSTLAETDLVFVDPPYSGVHYSRFYHVLETVANGGCGPVEGVGRYPARSERPSSKYSKKTESALAMEDLLEDLSDVGCKVVITFPAEDCSNGLSGTDVEDIASNFFEIDRKFVKTRFSTMGGNNTHRNARKLSNEMILVLRP